MGPQQRALSWNVATAFQNLLGPLTMFLRHTPTQKTTYQVLLKKQIEETTAADQNNMQIDDKEVLSC
jgi:hypothetical protein